MVFIRIASFPPLLALFLLFPVSGVQARPGDERPFKIVAFGSSLTERGGWARPLEAALRDCLPSPVRVAKIARSGATSDWAVAQLPRVAAEAPDVVLIEFYMNDAALYRFIGVSRSRTNMAALIGELKRRLPDARILVMAMNPLHGVRKLIRPFLDSYIEAHRQVAREKGAEFVDFRPRWLRLPADDLKAAIPDGLHPSEAAAASIMVGELAGRIAGGTCGAVTSGLPSAFEAQ